MYAMRRNNPKLCGYIYRRKVKCGKPTCRCAKSEKYRHTAYYLQFREWVNGQWKRRSQYVSRSQVRALRARIRRAKQKDREMQQNARNFLAQMPRLTKRIKHPPNLAALLTALDDAGELMKTLKSKALTKLQIWTIFAQVVDLIAAVVYPSNSLRE